jgi:alpha-L-rhamnosidase
MALHFAMRQSAARIRLVCFAAALVFPGCSQLCAQSQSAPIRSKPAVLECESLVRPMGVDAEQPSLSWKLHDPGVRARQTAYRILVATRPLLLDANKPDVWDSGRVNSDRSIGVAYGGPALLPETRYYWKVQVWDKDGKPYEDSDASWWETGLHGGWKAGWIGYEDLEHRSIRAARPRWITNSAVASYNGDGATRHDFRLSFDVSGTVKRAALYVTGEDTAAAWINGEQLLETRSQPKWGRTPWRTYSRADATRFLHSGNNLLAVEVLLYAGSRRSETPMSAELYLEMADGTVRVITTDDPSWKATMDAPESWYMPSSSDSSWTSAVPFAAQSDAFGAVEPLGNPLPTDPVVALRRDFDVAKPVRSARLFATALGAYKFHLNGQAVGDQVLSPGWTDFREHVTYQEYDVTSAIHQGENAVGAYLAPGWYSTPLEWVGQGNNYGDTPPALRAELRIEHTDGSVEWVLTDNSWRADDSPIEKAEIYDGETYDARKEQPGWDTSRFSAATWHAADVITPKPVQIEWQSFQPIRAVKPVPAISVNRLPDGRFIYDFGQDLAGVARIALQGKAGTEVMLRFGEVLNPDGTLYTENLRNAKATDHLILSGRGVEEYQPLFTFHGFRYMELSGLAEPLPLHDVTAVVLHTDAPNTIDLKTGNQMVNKLWSNILWGQWSNFVGVPTDCPQRDERLGWSADAQVFWRTASYNMDLAAFSRKYAADLRGTQATTPMYGIYAPGTTKPNPGFGAGWSDAGVIVPWTSWIQTGDPEILAENWNGMKQYVDAIEAANPDYLWKNKSGIAFGDWLSPEGTTSQVLISTAYWAYDVTLMKQMAHALGRIEDEQKYADEFAKIRTAFDHEFMRSDGFVGLPDQKAPTGPGGAADQDKPLTESQTGYVLALHMDLLPANLRPLAAKRLVDRIAANGWKLGTGFLGTPYLLEVLSDTGHSDVSYRLLLNVRYPSWGYMVEHGATTMWERWNGDAMRSDPGMNSYNHYAYGAVAEWIYRYAAGVDTDASDPGFHQILLHPNFDSRLGWLEASYQSPFGRITSNWHTEGETVRWDITIPPNATARLSLTPDEESRFRLQGKPLQESFAVAKQGGELGQVAYTIPAGHFSFVVRQPSPYSSNSEASPVNSSE